MLQGNGKETSAGVCSSCSVGRGQTFLIRAGTGQEDASLPQIAAVGWDTFILLTALNYLTVVQCSSSKWPHSFSEVGAMTHFLYIDSLKYKMLLLFFPCSCSQHTFFHV